jgi:hypothetical protein
MNFSWKLAAVLIILILAVVLLVLKSLWPVLHGM